MQVEVGKYYAVSVNKGMSWRWIFLCEGIISEVKAKGKIYDLTLKHKTGSEFIAWRTRIIREATLEEIELLQEAFDLILLEPYTNPEELRGTKLDKFMTYETRT